MIFISSFSHFNSRTSSVCWVSLEEKFGKIIDWILFEVERERESVDHQPIHISPFFCPKLSPFTSGLTLQTSIKPDVRVGMTNFIK